MCRQIKTYIFGQIQPPTKDANDACGRAVLRKQGSSHKLTTPILARDFVTAKFLGPNRLSLRGTTCHRSSAKAGFICPDLHNHLNRKSWVEWRSEDRDDAINQKALRFQSSALHNLHWWRNSIIFTGEEIICQRCIQQAQLPCNFDGFSPNILEPVAKQW